MTQQNTEYYYQLLAQQGSFPEALIAEVVLGMPSRDCKNFGICKIDLVGRNDRIDNTLSKTAPNKTVAGISVTKSNRLELAFIRKLMRPITEQCYFSDCFLIIEPISLPANICRQLGIEQFEIKAGAYEITASNTFFIVRFP
ncbi:MAG: hypothetical protein AAFP19_20240 [Bacteroidota bacterium]